jgi:hypothetical protein
MANFSHETGVAEASIEKAFGPISTVRLKVHSKSESWVILNEVHIDSFVDGSSRILSFRF